MITTRSTALILHVTGRRGQTARRTAATGPPTNLTRVTLYAAYGTNLDPARMGERCPHSPLRGTGWLEGWRLTFGGEDLGWDGALATVVEDPHEQVFVAVYDVTDEDDGPARPVGVRPTPACTASSACASRSSTGEVVAWMYVLDAYEGGLPSASYLGVLADAAEAAGAPDDYVADLRPRPAARPACCRAALAAPPHELPG